MSRQYSKNAPHCAEYARHAVDAGQDVDAADPCSESELPALPLASAGLDRVRGNKRGKGGPAPTFARIATMEPMSERYVHLDMDQH